MDLTKMIAELRLESGQIADVIISLERLGGRVGKRRGRPPAWIKAIKKHGRPPGSKNNITLCKCSFEEPG